jgi:tetratricopeptide (TPR) repeat protein
LKAKGKVEEGIACFRRAIAVDPKYAQAHYNLGVSLKAKGKVEEAIACFRRAIAVDPKYALAHHNLGIALTDKGKVEEAIACYRKAIELDPNLANAHGALGQVLMQQGQFGEACKALRGCMKLLPPEGPLRDFASRLLQQSQQSLVAEEMLTAFVVGKGAPADPAALVQMAALAQQPYKRLYQTSSRLYRDAFARQPALAAAHRYNAACAAALAGCGKGKDAAGLGPMQRLYWRRQALTWLRADLRAWQQLLVREPSRARPAVVRQMQHWLKDATFNGVRAAAALAGLPEAERQAWQQLWADGADLLARAKGKKPPEQKPASK